MLSMERNNMDDKDLEIYNKGIEAGKKHAVPSPDTNIAISGIQVELGKINITMGNIIKTVEDGFKGVHDRQDQTNGNVIKNTEWRLKNNKVPVIVYGMVGLVLVGVGGAVLTLIIK
jgi:hypothetical protein